MSPDGKLLADGGLGGGTIQMWDITTRKQAATLQGASSTAESVVFSPNGEFLAEGTPGAVQLWKVGTGEQVAAFASTGQDVPSAAFTPNGKILAIDTGSKVELWDVATSQQIGALTADDTKASSLSTGPSIAFSPDGTLLAASLAGGPAQLWSVSYLGDPVSYLCSLAGESFPPAEWTQEALGVPYQKTCP